MGEFHGVVVGGHLPPLILYLLIGVLGLIFGSFNSVLVSRIPVKESISGRSKCPSCGNQIANRDNLPILGYLILKGKCRNCHRVISPRYLVLEILTAISVFLPFLAFDRWFLILSWEVFIVLGIALAAIDLEHHRLPDVLTSSLYLFGLILISLDAVMSHWVHQLHNAFIASIVLGAFYWIVNLLSKGGMGMGDVKLATSIGLFTGYTSALAVYVASMTGFALGSLVGVSLVLAKKATRKSAVPFGPFMLVGAVASIWITPWITHLRGLS
jgi:leader peptidase (prepilin peptidase)/N-methyltransferase